MDFGIDYQINGEPATWDEILKRVGQTARAAAKGMDDLGSAFNDVFGETREAKRRRQVDDFIRWWAVHQDDEVLT